MSGRRALVFGGTAVAAAGGYYLYSAGGDPKVAQKKIEHDAASASSKLKGERISGKEAQKQGEEWAQSAGSKLDSTVDDIRKNIHDADAKITAKAGEAENKFEKLKNDGKGRFEQTRKETGKELNESIDKFDKTVEKKTAEAKSGISSWFGFGK